MDKLKVPITNVSELKKSPKKIIEQARKERNGVYIFNHNQPEAVVLTAADYEKLINKIEYLEEELLDYKVEKVAKDRINSSQKRYSVNDVFGDDLNKIKLDEDDGWE